MPELPEVETVKNTLHELVHGKKIIDVKIIREKTIDGDINNFKKSLIVSTITSFERIGKFIIFHFDKDFVMVSHLRMEGKYFLKCKDDKLTKHDLVVFYFSDNTCLIYNDTRRFGRLEVLPLSKYKDLPPLNNVGPDPFMMDNADKLVKAFKNKGIAIKTSLLDQSIMSGLGNIYVDEVLFATKIHPETPAKLITKKQLELILNESKRILKEACEAGGTTIKSYHPREGVSGNFQFALKVYNKKDKPCPNCGHLMHKTFVNGRGTTYCPNCQKNISLPFVIGITGPVGSGKSTVTSYFKENGFITYSCDTIVHELYKNKLVQEKLKNIIPELKITNGDVDRKYLVSYLIYNPNKKRRLEKLIHSLVSEYLIKEIKHLSQNDKVAIEAPLLFESRLDDYCDKTIYIEVNKEKQITNLKSRNDNVDIKLQLNSSFDCKTNKKKASYIVINNDNLKALYSQIDKIISYKR